MLFKWAMTGAVIGGILSAVAGKGFMIGAIIGGMMLYSLRKWFFETFWD